MRKNNGWFRVWRRPGSTSTRAVCGLVVAIAVFMSLLPPPRSADATIIVPLAEDALVEDATAIVIGQVTSIQAYHDQHRGRIRTHVTIGIAAVLKGEIAASELTLRQPGGSVGDLSSWIEGSPRFTRGEKVLLFLGQDRQGALRVAHLYQGKFTVFTDAASGDEYAVRETPPGVRALRSGGPFGSQPPAMDDLHRVRDLMDRIGRHRSRSPGRPHQGPARLPLSPEVSPDATSGGISADFSFLGPARWFEPDSRNPVVMKINATGEPLAPTYGFDQIRQAFQAWSDVSGASFRYQDGGVTDAAGFRSDGVNAVSFRDPDGDMDPPVHCSGTLAIGGYYSNGQTRVVNGTVFSRIVEGDLIFNDGWGGCNFYENFANFTEVATHELGHVLGLDHSTVADATMYPYAHFDGRGATLRQDDQNGLRAIYPAFGLAAARAGSGTGTVTSNPTGIDCGSDCTESYPAGVNVTLTAGPAPGSTFAGWSGEGCSGTGTCTVTMSAARSVTATFNLLSPPTFLLTLNTTGPGSGTVTSDPSGINCGTSCAASFVGGTSVVLTAIPGAGAQFIGWWLDGSRTGTGSLTVTMSQAHSVSAQFYWRPQDAGVYRNGTWYLDANGNGTWDGCATDKCLTWGGGATDQVVVGDWNGDGTTKIGVYRQATGYWYLDTNGNGTWDGCGVDTCMNWGGDPTDVPVVGDWNNNGTAKVGVYRQATGYWYLDTNGNGTWDGCGTDTCIAWGGDPTDVAVVGDWSGTGATKIGVYRAATGYWYLDTNGNGTWDGCSTDTCIPWGGDPTDVPKVGDWTGSGTTKIGVYRHATGYWYLDTNGNGAWDGCGTDACVNWGGDPGDQAVVGRW